MKATKRIIQCGLAVLILGALSGTAFGQANDVVCAQCINPSDIASKAVTSAKIGNSAVTSDKLSTGAVTTNKIADQAVTRSRLRAKAVTKEKLAPGALFPHSGGDGSAGDLMISSSVSWFSAPPANPNFDNITITGAGTLSVPAGTTISCAGDFINNGSIVVTGGPANRATSFATTDSIYMGYASQAHAGDSMAPASANDWHGDSVNNPQNLSGGTGGAAIDRARVITSLKRLSFGGGSGGGILSGANGGGLLIINCAGSTVNAGTITSNGVAGNIATGGGGGGIVVLASATTVDNSNGTVTANGGDGGNEQSNCCAPGGGGGGGIVVFVAPTIVSAGGVTSVSEGTGGTGSASPTSVARTAGGGGGASGGSGGSGANGGVTNSNGGSGGAGYVLEIPVDPATIL